MDERSFRNGLMKIAAEYQSADAACNKAKEQVPLIQKEKKKIRAEVNRIDPLLEESAGRVKRLRQGMTDYGARIAQLQGEVNQLDPQKDGERISDLQQKIETLQMRCAELEQMESQAFAMYQQLSQMRVELRARDQELKTQMEELKAQYGDVRQRLGTMGGYLEQGIRQYQQTQGAMGDVAATRFRTGAVQAQGRINPLLRDAEMLRKEIPALLNRYRAVFDVEGREREIER